MPGIDKLPIEETLEDSPQNELSAATHLTSKLLKEYEKQRFPLGGDDEVMSSTLQQFSKVIDELSSCHAVLSTQLADAMMFPITQFKERDLKEILTLKEVFQIASNVISVFQIMMLRLTDIADYQKKEKMTSILFVCFCCSTFYSHILLPQISFFKMGSENLSDQLEEFLTNIGTSVQNVRREMDNDVETMQQTIEDLEVASDPLYLPDPDPTKFPVNRNLTRKAGYLNARNKTGLVSSTWDRQFYFTQGGNLMSQARGDVAGGLAMDIDNCSVMAVDCEDRRYCFQITSFDGKKSSILQAESKKDHEEWICTINNISKQIYLSENPEEIAARVNQSALEAVTPSPSFQQRHESLRPAGPSRPPTARTSSSGSLGSESTNLAALSLDSLVAPDTPIQFDIISPVCEDQSGQAKAFGQGGRRTNPFGESEGGTKSETEDSILHQLFIVRFLGSMEVKSDDNPDVVYETMRQILAARAIHNIFRMTESHLLVTCDCLKLIDPQTQVTRLTFPLPSVVLYATHQENKRLFGFVLRTSGGRSESNLSSVCYIFESNNEGEKICDSVGLAKQIALHAELDRRASEKQKEIERVKEKQQKELSKQKQIEKDLEEQSRLIAASSRPNQASSEGQFVVLSSSQSEESDLGEEGKKRESEA
ncbi:DCC-interacting protein 13-alpha [Camelus dromedarius]|uniref:DCC-interacting protein 13-alpha n=1 Tax=Camelus dromedarius TaxID=9838 RepID=A0A5N4CZF6_CAMDR|nr:DCC-interacting protein 13-alpha [Camelus dromedarius]